MTTVRYEMARDAVALITLDRPAALNAFNQQMRADLLEAMRKASRDPAVRVIVLTGEGRGFCAGADIQDGGMNVGERHLGVEDALNTEYLPFLTIIRTCDKPVIAAINGPAAGIGMSVALTCDLRVMADDAYLMSAFANISLVPDGGLTQLLTDKLGYARAYEAAIEAQKLPADFCLENGLVNKVTSNEALLDDALNWAESLTARAPIALALTKRAMRAACQDDLHKASMTEALLQKQAIASEDFIEGVQAVLGKRAPAFKGR